jgi:hypothetical protein
MSGAVRIIRLDLTAKDLLAAAGRETRAASARYHATKTRSGHHQIYFGIAIIVAVMAFLAGPP